MLGTLGDTSMAYIRWEREGAGRLTHGDPFMVTEQSTAVFRARRETSHGRDGGDGGDGGVGQVTVTLAELAHTAPLTHAASRSSSRCQHYFPQIDTARPGQGPGYSRPLT